MAKRRKSALRRRRRTAQGPGDGAVKTVEIADRLYDVMAALSAVSDAVAGGELEGLQESGLRTILFRQIDEIETLRNIIRPPPAKSPSP